MLHFVVGEKRVIVVVLSAGYIQFIVKEVPDTSPQLLDNVLRILLQLLGTWRNAVTSANRVAQDDTQGPVSVRNNFFALF